MSKMDLKINPLDLWNEPSSIYAKPSRKKGSEDAADKKRRDKKRSDGRPDQGKDVEEVSSAILSQEIAQG